MERPGLVDYLLNGSAIDDQLQALKDAANVNISGHVNGVMIRQLNL